MGRTAGEGTRGRPVSPSGALRITYEVRTSDHIQISADATALAEAMTAGKDDGQPAEALKRLRSSERLTVSIKDDELTLTSDQGKSKRFRKLR